MKSKKEQVIDRFTEYFWDDHNEMLDTSDSEEVLKFLKKALTEVEKGARKDERKKFIKELDHASRWFDKLVGKFIIEGTSKAMIGDKGFKRMALQSYSF